MAALIAALAWSYFFRKTAMPQLPKLNLKKQTVATTALIALGAIFVSFVQNQTTLYTSDEVFSAVNFASLPKFQCISNYALPNNHLFFNAINGTIFSWSNDLVFTGRLISLFCYWATLCLTWFFLKKWTDSRWLSSLILLVLALQFPVLGFSWQARGYELVLLFSCLSLGTFVGYFTKRSPYLLTLHTVCNVVGILTLPTFLYWWLGLLLAGSLVQGFERKPDKPFITSSILGFSASFILYLPLLSFSGIGAVTDNKYVQSENTTHLHFLSHLNERHYFDGLFSEWFCVDNGSVFLGIMGLLLPMLLFAKSSKYRERMVLGVAYYSIGIAFLCMSVFILKLPYYRNMIAHGYLALLVPIIAILPYFRSKYMRPILGALLLIIAAVFAKKNYTRIPNNLYYYDVAHEFKKNKKTKININPLRPIYLDYESFYWWYVLQKKYPGQKLQIKPNRPKSSQPASQIVQHDSLSHTDPGLYQMLD
ncbi:MAG: hypothetical protein IPM82_01795 [Saprospiraceae bacterium]|nr:hypothetical protein [Saprospiraceae bacterium]